MSKNYVDIYEGGNLSSSLEQKIFIKQELLRGQMVLPSGTDFLYHLAGASINFSQPVESSPYKSGRHHTSVIKQKSSTEWTLPIYFNIDESLSSPSENEIDIAVRVLFKSAFGYEDSTTGLLYDTRNTPSITFTMFEIGDLWAKQCFGAFVEGVTLSFAGDGVAQAEFAGRAKYVYTVGIGKSTTNNNGGNTITLQTDEGKRFPVGAKVMIIKNNNAKSSDTPAGTARTVTSVNGDIITVDGAVLADADGSTNPVYLVYYEPEGATAINNPITGLSGSVTIQGWGTIAGCIRNFTLTCANNHEIQDYCYGEEGLGGKLFVAGGRFTAEVSMELNLSKELVGFINNLKTLQGNNITLILGDSSKRHLEVIVPKAIFAIPEISVPETGSIPVTFTGNAYQTGLDQADEVTIKFI